jgi:hypothetical protein
MSSYQPTADEWPLHGVDIERERLVKGIDILIQMDVAEQFRAPGKLKLKFIVLMYLCFYV